MERVFYKELWRIRFAKMLQLEEQSVTDYQVLLKECQKKYKGHSIEANLEKLMRSLAGAPRIEANLVAAR